MARTNKPAAVLNKEKTHEGAPAKIINAEKQLRRSLMACLLWEDKFYEEGVEIAERLKALVPAVDADAVFRMAVEARNLQKLRHAPLLIAREMARHPQHKKRVAELLSVIVQRADELAEFLAMYWQPKKQPLSAQVKKGLALAFRKFDEYQLAKYNRDNAVKLRDVLFLCHAKPQDEAQAALWKRLAENKLETPDTWEVELSSGKDKKATWERLIKEDKLGALAFLRNLRNMHEAGVEEKLVFGGLKAMRTGRVLPFRFIAAARHAPQWENEIEPVMLKSIEGKEKLPGKTLLLIDVSGSMDSTISGRSEMKGTDVAAGLAVLAREMCEQVQVFTFSNDVVQVPNRRGFGLRDAVVNSQDHGGTYLGKAVEAMAKIKADRLIVLTDEQSHDSVSDAGQKEAYMVNVSTNKNGVGYGKWIHIDGWSEAILDYIRVAEVG